METEERIACAACGKDLGPRMSQGASFAPGYRYLCFDCLRKGHVGDFEGIPKNTGTPAEGCE